MWAPDGSAVAFLWDEGIAAGLVDREYLTRNTYLYWSRASDLKDRRRVHLVSCVGSDAGYHSAEWGVQFAPDSQRVAAIAPPNHRLLIVDLASGSHEALTGPPDLVTSFAWIGPREIGYVTCSPGSSNRAHRRFWRQLVAPAVGERRCIHDDGDIEADAVLYARKPLESWSPTGQHVLYMKPSYRGCLNLLGTVTGAVQGIGDSGMHMLGAAWRPDGAQAFCILDVTGDVGHQQALLVDAMTGNVRDVTAAYRGSFSADVYPDVERRWTEDGRYVLLNTSPDGAYLIRPEPWEVIALGTKLIGRDQIGSRAPWLFRLPVAGWVGVCAYDKSAQFTRGAVDYQGERIVPLEAAWSARAISADGSRAATVDDTKQVRIHELGSWWTDRADPGQAGNVDRPSGTNEGR
jgi:hypothetical protein